jgi:hypothetical protein
VENGANTIFTFLSAFTMPVEMIIRPFFGSQYFSPISHLYAAIVMVVLLMILSAFNTVPAIFIAAHIQPPQALFQLSSLAKLFFLLSLVHGVRIAWLKFDVSREQHSRYEGPALLPIRLLPWGQSFWICRILIEPAVIAVVALYMRRLMIFDAALSNFLLFAALCLVAKQYLTWHSSWCFQRDILDAKFAGPVLAALLDDTANAKELDKLHIVSIPKSTPPDVRRATVEHMVRVISQSDYTAIPGGNNAANG